MKKYVIKETSEVSAQHYAASTGEESTQRKSLDGSKVLLKFSGSTPSIFESETIYSQEEIWAILEGVAWTGGLS